jgi:hypothetical protein
MLVEEVLESRRRSRAYKRLWRRRLLIMQRTGLWVATHSLDAKRPTRLHQTFQEDRRTDPAN